jgi:2-iminobutanoate/2-iminopropanoate deaminase
VVTEAIYHSVPDASPPPASSLYCHAVQADGWLHISGQLPTNPDAPAAPLALGIRAQTEMCFENILRILRHADYELKHTVYVRIYLKEFERDFIEFNEVYARHFSNMKLPCRTTIGVAALGRGALVELDVVCFRAAPV